MRWVYLCSGCRLPCGKRQTILPCKRFSCVWLGGSSFFMRFSSFFMVTPHDISTLVINGTRFSRDLGALWVHLFLWGVMANTHPEICLLLEILNIINLLFDCNMWTFVSKVTCKEPEGEITTH